MAIVTEIDDGYPTCARTYATLCILGDDLDPGLVTRMLGIEPSDSQVKGQPRGDRPGGVRVPEIGGWFLSTRGQVDSRDVRRHLVWLLDRLSGCGPGLKSLRDEGHRTDVFCYWLSARGQGGPMLSPEIMRSLGELGLGIGFDVYG